MRPVGLPVLLLLITSAQKNAPCWWRPPASAASVLMVKLSVYSALLPHWLDPPLDCTVMAMPFVKLNVLPLAAGAWIASGANSVRRSIGAGCRHCTWNPAGV